ncbi:MAG: hypothetical protein JNL42_23660, partial [Anaerolineae bacterium]|nr:hypothetical protein [Anaerolineae bacterium]
MLAWHKVKPIIQQDWYCGPATLAMLYSAFGRTYSQEAVAEATGIRPHIPTRGCRVDQLAYAVGALTPDFILLARYDASLDDLHALTDALGCPAAVEWRGTFLEPNGHLWHEGHYSIVQRLDFDAGVVHLIDPFNGSNIAHQNGVIAIDDFLARWWDDNYLPAPDARDPFDPDTWTDHI